LRQSPLERVEQYLPLLSPGRQFGFALLALILYPISASTASKLLINSTLILYLVLAMISNETIPLLSGIFVLGVIIGMLIIAWLWTRDNKK
jgi:hypothetical protein